MTIVAKAYRTVKSDEDLEEVLRYADIIKMKIK